MKNKRLTMLTATLAMVLLTGCTNATQQADTIAEQSQIQGTAANMEENIAMITDADVTAYIELSIQEYALELTGDTMPETLHMYLLGNEGDDTTKAEYLVENKVRQILVRVTDGANEDTVLYERKFSHTHFEMCGTARIRFRLRKANDYEIQ